MTLNDIFDFVQLAFSWVIVELVFVPIAWTSSDQAFLDTPIAIFPLVIALFALFYTGAYFSLAGVFYWGERLVRFVIRKPKEDPSDTKTHRFIERTVVIGAFVVTAIFWDATSRLLNS